MNSSQISTDTVLGGVTWRTGVAIVIPCYKVLTHIQAVLAGIGPETDRIYCIDDACPERSGAFIEANCHDPRVVVLRNAVNEGVGGAVMHGYRQAVADGATVIVKLDGDGQMDPTLIEYFVAPILHGDADYTKGNRFYDLREIRSMPLVRRVGNLVLSFMAKASSGYWDVFDPTNGYTAIHASVARRLPLESISRRYFFETDMLFRLNTLRAVVMDIPMDARYGDEVSGLKISKIIGEFASKHARNTIKRLLYNYFLRDMSIASMELLAASLLLAFGVLFGGWTWWHSAVTHASTPTGTVMIVTVALVAGLQFLLAFLGYDTSNVPRQPLHPRLQRWSLSGTTDGT